MRILLCCSWDLNGCINLNRLVPALCSQHTVEVLLSNLELPLERGHHWADLKCFYERDFPLGTLFPAVDALADDSAPLLTFDGLVRRYGITVHPVPLTSAHAFMAARTTDFAPDIIACCRFDYILREAVFSQARAGAFNLHSGLLPRFAGPDASFWTMLRHSFWSGYTLHELTREVDKGDVVSQEFFRLRPGQSLLANRCRSYSLGLQALLTAIDRLDSDRCVPSYAQELSFYHYDGFPSENDFDQFISAGLQLADPQKYATLLEQFLPAQTPLHIAALDERVELAMH